MSTQVIRRRKRVLRARSLVLGCAVAVAAAIGSLAWGGAAGATSNADQITIAVTGATATQDVPFLAETKGYFAKRGLDVKVTLLPSSQAVAAVAAGQVQFIVGAEPGGASITAWSSANAASKDKPVKLLGYWQPKAGGIVVVGRPGINTVAGLKGKTLGVTSPGGASAILLDLVLSRVGHLKASDVKVVPLGTLGAVVAAFNTGNISAMSSTEPLTTQVLQGAPGSKVIFDEAKWSWVLGGIAGYMPWVKAHPGQTVQVLAAINDALAAYHTSPADAEATIGKVGGITDEGQLVSAYKSSIPFITTKVQPVSEANMRAVLHAMKQNGTPAANPNRWKEMVDSTYALRAQKIK
jgi:NitT/TauT family transport system substrate-binding protein